MKNDPYHKLVNGRLVAIDPPHLQVKPRKLTKKEKEDLEKTQKIINRMFVLLNK